MARTPPSAFRQHLHGIAGKSILGLRHRLKKGVSLGVRGLAFSDAGEVFLVRHSYLPGFHLPGGGVDPGESAYAAMVRELREEGNLELTEPGAFFGFYFNPSLGNRDHVALYVARSVRQPAPPRVPNSEILEARFFALDALPDETTPATRRRLAEVLKGAPVSEHW
ncbi:NUDIX domain-containing protein [Amorphus orientalis]|uniref:8-oxo-dGTP pyrophosphatase MutT (NUDIX family) n=1 Tax=Amorphus orientalis TaxID=649198 RepID=A0AAE4ASZ6_9HYPH|nr:NUDIX domain-containing protein [Amorphus orientalis]MDQ0315525.1 8-oxo-dGTP pyrophosphatase MutT (NUDIX family) [Amorphus orientalis]